MILAGFQKNSTIDFPGKLSCVIFAANCNYDCYYCHNRHLLGAQEKVFEQEIFEFLNKRRGLIEGVVITGGEPALYDDLPEFTEKIKKLDYEVKLDTNGSSPEMVKSLIEGKLLDFVAIDYKAPFEKYDIINAVKDTEINKEKVTESMEYVMNSGIDYEIRTTMVPEITEDDIIGMAKSFPEFNSFILQKYRPVPDDTGERPGRIYYKKEDLERISEIIKKYQPNVSIRA